MVSPESSSLVEGQAGPSCRYGTVDNETRRGSKAENEPEEPAITATSLTRRDCAIVVLVLVLVLALNGVTIGFGLPALARKRALYCNLTIPASDSPLKSFKSYVVLSDVDYCAPIGANVIADGGSAVDAAIATLFCNGAVHPHAMGIGGGSIFTIYNYATRTATIIDGRETAPIGSEDFPIGNLSTGVQSIAIPGEVRAYEEAHSLFGRMPWKQLVQPTIDLCRKGFPVTRELANALASNRHRISADPNLRMAYFNKEKRRIFIEGETMTCTELADTLETIRDHKAAAFYDGPVGAQLIGDLARQGSKLRLADLREYKVELRKALQKELPRAKVTLYSPPPPANGAILSLILDVLDSYGYSAVNLTDIYSASKMFHEIVQSFKIGYAAKVQLEDDTFLSNRSVLDYIMSAKLTGQIRYAIDNATHPAEFYPALSSPPEEERGSSHTTVMTSNGDAVAVSSSINGNFGSFIISPRTGILLNSHMTDFSTNASAPNAVASRKRPMSSMAPAIFVDAKNGKPSLVAGASGGSRITTGEAQVALRTLYLGENVKEAVDAPRVHYQRELDTVLYEQRFPGILVERLNLKGHKLAEDREHSAVNAVSMNSTGIYANLDFRRRGSIAGL